MAALDPSMPSLRVIVRGWLNCNQILLLDDGGNVVIDTGHSAGADETLALLQAPENLGNRPLARVINTHCHADHMGGNAALIRRYRCAVSVPAADAENVRSWNRAAFLLDYADQRIDRFDYADTLAVGDAFRAGGLAWQVLAAPGHDANALMFWCEPERVLITGDALWENGLGVMFPEPTLVQALSGGYATLDRIAALAPRWIIPGHGAPFSDTRGAVERARRKLDAFAADPAKNARHALKSLFVFALLERKGMPVDALRAYVVAVPCFHDLNERYLGKPLTQLAEELVAELVRAKAVTIDAGWIRPTPPA